MPDQTVSLPLKDALPSLGSPDGIHRLAMSFLPDLAGASRATRADLGDVHGPGGRLDVVGEVLARGRDEQPVQAAPAVSTEDDTAEATAVSAPAAVPQGVGSGAVAIGSNYLGTPYVWGGGGPGGFDCSGFVSYVYAQMGISLPHQSGDILNSGTVISASEARPGDILWWPGHVGIYAGDGQVLHSTPGPGVSITNIWGSPTYLRVG